jgi:ribose 5-phosphate isomerase B
MQKSIIIGSDHAGFELKCKMVDLLISEGYEVKDVGTHSSDSTDYPEFAHAVAAGVDDVEIVDVSAGPSTNNLAVIEELRPIPTLVPLS